MKELYNFFYRSTPDGFMRLSSATATWATVRVENHYFTQARYLFDVGTSNASAGAKGLSFVASIFTSPDGKAWYLHTVLPSLTTAGARGYKHYSLYLPYLTGEVVGLRYSCHAASAGSRTNFRARIQFADTDYSKY